MKAWGRTIVSASRRFRHVLPCLFGLISLWRITASSAAIYYVQGNFDSPLATETSVAAAYTGVQTAGDLNVVIISWEQSSGSVSSITDTSGNTYTVAVGPTTISGIASQTIYYAKNIVSAGAGANSVTVAFSGTGVPHPDLRILEYSGIDPTNAFDVGNGGTGSSTSLNSGSVTTTNANDLLVGADVIAHDNGSPGSGYTQRLLTTHDDIAEDKTVSTAGSYNATATQTPSGWWVMQVAAFRANQWTVGSPVTSPYPPSKILGSISWSETSKQRYASGSDIWESVWASDGNVYGAWGDGTGFAGTSKTQIGVSQISGLPSSGPITGTDVYFGSPPASTCLSLTSVGGKPHAIVALPSSSMYLIHKIQDHCSTSVLAHSTNNGTSWSDQIGGTSLVWPDSNGFDPNAILQYGEAQAGGLSPDSTGTQYLYIYLAGNFRYSGYTGSDLIYTYLARVPESPSNAIETVTNWSYFLGTTAAGDPIWSTSDNDAEAAPVWADLNNADSVSVVFDSAIGRYIAYNDHGNACTSDGSSGPCERQVSLFDAPSPWGPWTTFDYEENFDNTGCGTNCLSTGPAVGWSMVQKWIGSDGLSIWPEYSSIEVSSTADYDSLNLIKGTISLASSSTIDTLVLSTGKPAVLDTLSISNPGNLEYIDRTYRLTSVPTSYVGKEMIRLPNNDKTATASNYVSFNSTIAQSVCVAWDLRNTLPTWLSGWTNTGNTLVGNTTFTVFSKAFSAGTVTIPGPNAADMYLLFVGC